MASWHGTDLFMANYQDLLNTAGGYFSYPEDDRTTCIFFSDDDKPQIIASFSFDSTFSTHTVVIDVGRRKMNQLERDIYEIREVALDEINNDEDSLFKHYKNSNLNLIPIVDGSLKEVYVLTGPTVTGVVIFGNDYLISFDNKNRVTDKRALHNDIMVIEYGENDSTEPIGSMHMHTATTGEYPTATDICTLMLYAKYTDWQFHAIMGDHLISVWDCADGELKVRTGDEFLQQDFNQFMNDD